MKKTLIFRLTEEEREQLQRAALAEDRTITALIRRALSPYLTGGQLPPDTPTPPRQPATLLHND